MICETDENGFVVARQCECLQQEIANTRLAFASIPKEFEDLKISSFDLNKYKTRHGKNIATIAKKVCINYIKNFDKMQELGKGLYLHSQTKGSGKTRMAVSIGNALINYANKRVRFIKTVDLLLEIKSTYDKQYSDQYTEAKLIEDVKNVDVIILDDIGVERDSPWVNQIFYNILDGRMIQKKITIFTSNCPVEQLNLNDRIINRIERMAMPVKFPEESIRRYLSQNENELIQDKLLRGGF